MKETKRLFVALDFDTQVKSEISRLCNNLAAAGVRGGFTPSANMHLTLKFLGDVQPAQLPSITAALGAIRASRLTLTPSRLGVFSSHDEKTVFLGVEGEGLSALAEAVDQALSTVGFSLEKRPFVPHITIARRAVDTQEALNSLKLPVFTQSVFETTLFESRRDGGRLWYKPLCRAKFTT